MSAHLNQVAESNPEWKLTIKDHQARGLYVPDNIMLPVIDKVFGAFNDSPGIVIDGGTRTKAQAELFYKHLRERSYTISAFYINAPQQLCVERSLRRGRADDTEDIIMTRFQQFESYTMPAIDWMRSQPEGLVDIDGTESLEVKFTQLFSAIGLLHMATDVTQIVEQKIAAERAKAERVNVLQ